MLGWPVFYATLYCQYRLFPLFFSFYYHWSNKGIMGKDEMRNFSFNEEEVEWKVHDELWSKWELLIQLTHLCKMLFKKLTRICSTDGLYLGFRCAEVEYFENTIFDLVRIFSFLFHRRIHILDEWFFLRVLISNLGPD